ncbi:MAG: tetratricopeptide repeat protein, partial [Muribaculaceae bacterium]|nr:tetratricopeptide repeat protein [Muribaculaceae bacterium]
MKRYEAADLTCSRLIKLYPKFEDGISARARLRMLQGDTIKALEDLDASLKLSPAMLNPYLMRAEIYAKQKKWAEASADMDQAIKLHPQDADYYLNRAYLRYNNDDFIGAMADYNTALELRPYNVSALFNRALLRYEVRDLVRAVKDLDEVLKIEPENFHARYNRALMLLELGNYREAIKGFESIASRYPRFYPAYYAIAEAYHKMGDMRAAMMNVHKAEELIKRYVKNPKGFKLDKPTIASGTNTKGFDDDKAVGSDEEESDMKVMERFNQLVTVSASGQPQLSYNERIKGRVQDRNMSVEPEASYSLSFNESPRSLKITSNYFRELDDFNQGNYVAEKIYLSPGVSGPEDEKSAEDIFAKVEYYNG